VLVQNYIIIVYLQWVFWLDGFDEYNQ